MTAQRLLTVTNCQGPTLVQRFLRRACPDFENRFAVIPPVQVHLLAPDSVEAVAAAIEVADVILAQPIAKSAIPEVEYLNLKRRAGSKTLILFPALHYDAIFATASKSVWTKHEPYPFGDTEDQALAAAFCLGITEQAAIQAWHEVPIYSGTELAAMLESNLQEFEAREARFDLDVRMSDFYRTAWRTDVLHHVKSHPRATTYEALADRLAPRLDLIAPDFQLAPQRRGNDVFGLPLKRWVHAALGMAVDEDFESGFLQNNSVPLREIVKVLWSYYSSVGRETVLHRLSGQAHFDRSIVVLREAGLSRGVARS